MSFERVAGSGVWHVRFRINGKLGRKSFGADRISAVAYVEKARKLRRSGDEYAQPMQPSGVADTTKTASATITGYPTVVLAALPLGLVRYRV